MRFWHKILIGGIIFISICVLGWGLLMNYATHAGRDGFTFKEQLVQSKYDIVYPGASFHMGQRHNGDGVYYAIYDSHSENFDFASISADSLRHTADALYSDLAPVIPDRDEYDSLSVRFRTEYPSKPPGERRLYDTVFKPYVFIVSYSLR